MASRRAVLVAALSLGVHSAWAAEEVLPPTNELLSETQRAERSFHVRSSKARLSSESTRDDVFAFDRLSLRLMICEDGRTESCKAYQMPERTVDVIPMSHGGPGTRDVLLALQSNGEALRCGLIASRQLACERGNASAMGGGVQPRSTAKATFVRVNATNGEVLDCTILPVGRGARCTDARYLSKAGDGLHFGSSQSASSVGAVLLRDGVPSPCDFSATSPVCRPTQGLELLARSPQALVSVLYSFRTGRADPVAVTGLQLHLCRQRLPDADQGRFSCRTEDLGLDVGDLKIAVVVGRSRRTGVPMAESLAVLPSRSLLAHLPVLPVGETFEVEQVRAL
jgi:hypothetical protein